MCLIPRVVLKARFGLKRSQTPMIVIKKVPELSAAENPDFERLALEDGELKSTKVDGRY